MCIVLEYLPVAATVAFMGSLTQLQVDSSICGCLCADMAHPWCWEIISSCTFNRTGFWNLSVVRSPSHAVYQLVVFLSLACWFLVTAPPSTCMEVPAELVT